MSADDDPRPRGGDGALARRGGALTEGGRQLAAAGGGAIALPGGGRLEEDQVSQRARIWWQTILKWRWLILACAVIGVTVGAIMTLLTTPLYRATARIEIASQEAKIVEQGDVQQLSMSDPQFLATQYGLLRSRTLAERVAREANLAVNPAFVPQGGAREGRERAAAGKVAGNLKVTPVVGSRLIDLSFTSDSPAIAAQVANSYADNFIASNLERKYGATAYARQFLQNRIAAVKTALEKSERDLVAYAQQQRIVTLASGTDGDGSAQGMSLDSSSLAAINASLADATNARISAEQRYKQAVASGSSTELISNSVVQGLITQRNQLQADYEDKLNTLKPDFPDMIELRSRIDAITKQIAAQTRSISTALATDYRAAAAREAGLRAQVNQLQSNVLNLRGRSIQYNILQREVDTNRSLYEALLSRYKEVGVAGGVGTNLVSVVDRAEAPGRPFSPNLGQNLLIAVLLGLAAGLGIAFGIEFIDDTIKTAEDVTVKLGLASVGVVPVAAKGESVATLLQNPQSPISEAYFSLRTAISFASAGGAPRSLLITSTRAGEGKSSSALAIAQNFARIGKNTLLIDSDMRKPSFGANVGDEVGLSALLAGDTRLEQHVIPTSIPHLSLLPSGPIPPSPAELLSSERMRHILDDAEQAFDIVVVDAPPVLGLADAPLLASMCQATLMVIEAGKIRRPAVLYSVNRLRSAGAHMIGALLTKFNFKSSVYSSGYGYGYESYYGYTAQEGETKRRIELSAS